MNLFKMITLGLRPTVRFEDTMKQQLQWMMLLRLILYTVLLGINLLLQDERFGLVSMPPPLLALFILSVYMVTIGSALWLLNSTSGFRRFGFIQTLIDAFLATILIYLSGGSQSIFTSVYFFPVIAGGLLIPIKGGLIGAAASTLLYGTVLSLEYFGLQPSYVASSGGGSVISLFVAVNHFSIKGLTFFLAAFLSAIFGARLKSATEALSSTKYDFDRLSLLHKQIFDSINTGILTVDKTGVITSVNNATAGITGLPIAKMIGEKLGTLFPGIDLTIDAPRNACDFERHDKQKIRLGYAHAALQRPDSRQYVKTREPEDDVTIITLKDIGEIERLEAQMRQAEKLAAIGIMSASIAHDFRNPLAAISGSAQILAQEFSDAGPGREHNYELSKIILRESERLTKTIADFLKFARPDSIDREWVLLLPCLEEIMQVCQAAPNWPESCQVSLEVEQNCRVWADEKQLFTLISHLVYNAIAFCPKGKEQLVIEAPVHTGTDGSPVQCVAISDNGPGVAQNDSGQIFEPFFTTRSDGTGLGLAIAKQTMEAHGGTITADRSAELGGACFTLCFPLPKDT